MKKEEFDDSLYDSCYQWRENNREYYNKYIREWRNKDKDKYNAWQRDYRKRKKLEKLEK